jgi:uncharacterized membrane protein YadS
MFLPVKVRLPGLLVAVVIALASAFVADNYGVPALLYALLLGMALDHLTADATCRPEINFAARPETLEEGIRRLADHFGG